jgi:hypothetical protein
MGIALKIIYRPVADFILDLIPKIEPAELHNEYPDWLSFKLEKLEREDDEGQVFYHEFGGIVPKSKPNGITFRFEFDLLEIDEYCLDNNQGVAILTILHSLIDTHLRGKCNLRIIKQTEDVFTFSATFTNEKKKAKPKLTALQKQLVAQSKREAGKLQF